MARTLKSVLSDMGQVMLALAPISLLSACKGSESLPAKLTLNMSSHAVLVDNTFYQSSDMTLSAKVELTLSDDATHYHGSAPLHYDEFVHSAYCGCWDYYGIDGAIAVDIEVDAKKQSSIDVADLGVHIEIDAPTEHWWYTVGIADEYGCMQNMERVDEVNWAVTWYYTHQPEFEADLTSSDDLPKFRYLLTDWTMNNSQNSAEWSYQRYMDNPEGSDDVALTDESEFSISAGSSTGVFTSGYLLLYSGDVGHGL